MIIDNGNTPLHKIATYFHKFNLYSLYSINLLEIIYEIINILIKKGVHFDTINRYSQTFTSIQNVISLNSFYYINLQCLAVRVIKKRINDYIYFFFT